MTTTTVKQFEFGGIGELLGSVSGQKADLDFNPEKPLSECFPDEQQPRPDINEQSTQDIIESLKAPNGRIWNPILLRENGRIITGGRRYFASVYVGNETIPALVWRQPNNMSDTEYEKMIRLVQLMENITRQSLDIRHEGKGFKALKEQFKMKGKEIAAFVGKRQGYVSEAITMYDMSADPSLSFLNNLYESGECKDVTILVKLIGFARKDADGCKRMVGIAIQNGNLTRDFVKALTDSDLTSSAEEQLQNWSDRKKLENKPLSTTTVPAGMTNEESKSLKEEVEETQHQDSNTTPIDDANTSDDEVEHPADTDTDTADTCEYVLRPKSKALVSVLWNERTAQVMLDRVDKQEGYVWLDVDGEPMRVAIDSIQLLHVG